ncbi:T9SS type B sorting domain-containing protein [Zunongwangia sp. HRR-M8]|uniref:T9SS type B sorting domain-containing protein n=1 Tax=Zunongwangia sp. HRR-M8 TaxID=3015170 RepID=UPI0022DE2E55|nr:T9SS type B sorting domain-containing protein [Zunongwangia sp. HRR-M8]WBL21638.1 T9SS type B sorting domain-containing protein [Zunongwangia sp. HRR-M8]
MKKTLLFLFFLSLQCLHAQITLDHNIGTNLIDSGMPSCEEDESWARIFKVSDFGVGPGEQLIIRSAEIGLLQTNPGASMYFSVGGFVDYNSKTPGYENPYNNLGQRGLGSPPVVTGGPEIFSYQFEQPIVVPANYEYIIIIFHKQDDHYNPESSLFKVAGTTNDTGESWYLGCDQRYLWRNTNELPTPIPNANFYINAKADIVPLELTGSTTRLSHNTCDDIIETDIYSCKDSFIYWARDFQLAKYGISNDEEFIIKSGQVAVNKTGWTANLTFNIYEIDDNFPYSFSEDNLIGSSQTERLQPDIGRSSQIITVNFETPVTVPTGVKRILVEVHKGIIGGQGVAFIAGSTQDTGTSWQRNCTPNHDNIYRSTADFGFPDANFYINVTGDVKHKLNIFSMSISNICSEFLKEFSIEDEAKLSSVQWDFGDPASGTDNTSDQLSPYHDFSKDGIYTITARVTGKDGRIESLSETIDVKEPPTAYGIKDVYTCETTAGTGISNSFDLSHVEQQVLQGQTGKVITYIDGTGKSYDALPNPFTNRVINRETIKVRVAHADNPCCYSETSFDLIVNPLPHINPIDDLVFCDTDTDGFTTFDISSLRNDLLGSQPDLELTLIHEDGQQIMEPLPQKVSNKVSNQETIRVQVLNTRTGCSSESSFKLIVSNIPNIGSLPDLIGCDDNNDGISEYFDTSQIENLVLNGQTGTAITYYDAAGNSLPSPLPNPYISTKEAITIRVTNSQTGCYAETKLNLITSAKPQINQPVIRFACDVGNGYSTFDLSSLEQEIIGSQTGLKIYYFDENGTTLSSPLSDNFQNTSAWSQRIAIRVENSSNSLCFSETYLDLTVNALPELAIDNNFVICDQEPGLQLSRNETFDLWQWEDPTGSIISNTSEAYLSLEGSYVLTIGENQNGIMCKNSYVFQLKRSESPAIQKVDFADWSNNNYIEIQTIGDGDFEYSIDGFNFQDSELFPYISGGVYDVTIRDKAGCGTDSKKVVLIDYKKFFTPNGDGFNDYWQIEGIDAFPDATILIYDRYGKLLRQLTPQDIGWDGTFKSGQMPSDDYWFHVDLGNGRVYKNHFTLKR